MDWQARCVFACHGTVSRGRFRLGMAGMALFGEVWCGVPRYGVAGMAS